MNILNVNLRGDNVISVFLFKGFIILNNKIFEIQLIIFLFLFLVHTIPTYVQNFRDTI